jgi:integrase
MSTTNRSTRRSPEGVEERHETSCRSRKQNGGGRCNCTPSYRGYATTPVGKKLRSPWGPSIKAAQNWRADTLASIRRGTLVEPSSVTVRDAAAEFIDGARAGHIHSRRRKPYRPKVVEEYNAKLNNYLLPEFGDRPLSRLQRADVQRFVDRLNADGLDGSTVNNTLDPLRRICDRAVKRDLIAIDPTDHLELPRAMGKRERVAGPAEMVELIAALPDRERALFAAAAFGGMRSGELRALRCSDIDMDADAIYVERAWDDVGGEMPDGKSDAATRSLPIIPELRPYLVRHLILTGRRGDDLIFGRTADEPFVRSTVDARAKRAWGWKKVPNPDSDGTPKQIWVKVREDALEPIGVHECRHTFISTMRAAGVDTGEAMRLAGQASMAILDRYTHALPGSTVEAARRIQAFIDSEQKRATG